MKKEDILTYLVLWGVLLSICLYLIYTGAPFSIYAKERQALNPETEDIFLYEQLVAENEQQAQKAQKDLESQVLMENGTAQAGTPQDGGGDGSTALEGGNAGAEGAQSTSENAGAEGAQSTSEGGNADTEGSQNTSEGGSAGVADSGIAGGDGAQAAASGQDGGSADSGSGPLNEDTASGQGGETQAVLSSAVTLFTQSGNFLNECFIVDPDTTLLESEVPAEELLGKNMKITSDAGQPQILIYHTHGTEGYADSSDDDTSTTVIGVGDYLEELLTAYGYHVLHVEEKYDLVEGQLERSRAYNYACDDLEQILAENPSIEVIIDLHRDGVDEDRRLVTEIDGKSTAQIMFFTGLCRTNASGELTSTPNEYIQDNLAFAAQLDTLGEAYYPGYVRGVYVKGYRYNLHFRPKSLLLEVGAQTNTVEEAMNAMVPFADILNKLLKGA